MKNFSRRNVLIAGAGGALATGWGLTQAQSGFPNRPITLVVPWGAGGGTDATARQMGALLEKELRQPVNVVNRTGGSGVVGHSAIAMAAPDGYTIGMVTVEVTMLQQQGLTTLTPADFTPLAMLVSPSPGVIVKSDSPYKDIKELSDAIKAAPPGKFKASGTGQGGSWHIGLVGWLISMRLKPDHVTWVPSQGAAPALQEVAAGGIDFATCSVPEARALMEAGKVRALANMAIKRNPAFPNVPTVAEATGVKHTFGAWIGMAAPKGLPADVRDKLVAAIKQANDSKEFNDFLAGRGLAPRWMNSAEFGAHMAEQVQSNTPLLQALGMVKS